jgi:FG-GAP-like repeat
VESPRRFSILTAILLLLVLLLPAGIYFGLAATKPIPPVIEVTHAREDFSASRVRFIKGRLGARPMVPAIITNVQIVDFDRDGLPDVIACDAQRGRVLWYRQVKRGEWKEIVLNTGRLLPSPGRATVVDLNKDGHNDVLVACLGSYMPTDEHVGRAVWLENDGKNRFTTHVLLEDVGRVTDVEAGDLNGDGHLDLVISAFGHYRGKVAWLENDGKQRFREHELLAMPGVIHVPLADLDGDGDLDIAVLLSQDEESVVAFENLGGGKFRKQRTLFASSNFDLGTAGLVPCDLEKDGKTDFLLVAGDNLELHVNFPQPWHGCLWLHNRGGWKFETKRLATFGGTYSAAVGDIDGDGDLDVVLVSMFNDWHRKDASSIVWLENDGTQNFKTWRIDSAPIEMATVACGDLNGDGRADVVAGSFHVVPPFDRLGRITTWTSQPSDSQGKR